MLTVVIHIRKEENRKRYSDIDVENLPFDLVTLGAFKDPMLYSDFYYSGKQMPIHEHVKLLLDSGYIGDHGIWVTVRMKDSANLKTDLDGLKVVSKIGQVYGCLINFSAWVELLKDENALNIEYSS